MDSTARQFGKGLAFPPRIGEDGAWAWSEGEQNIAENIRVILMTEPGERLMLPAFGGGLRRFLFKPNHPGTHADIREAILGALARHEPRVRVQNVVVESDAEDPRSALAVITFRMVADGRLLSQSLRVDLQG
jgi:predicted component of type VI protein secretion system